MLNTTSIKLVICTQTLSALALYSSYIYTNTMSEQNNMNFSLTILPGLEDLAEDEFIEKWSLVNNSSAPDITRKKGKLLVTSPIAEFCSLIPYLRIPTDAYIIISEFIARDRPKVFNRISKILWSVYLRGDLPLIIVSTRESKLIHSNLVKDTVEDGIRNALKKAPLKRAPKELEHLKNKIHIDLYQDRLRVSLSLCGQRMDKRGVKLFTDRAPLRESIAAAMLYRLHKECGEKKLLDPMSGTGTFSLEAHLFYMYNTYRDFDYQYAPFFITLPLKKRVSIDKKLYGEVYTADHNLKSITSIKENFKSINLPIENVHVRDFFTSKEKNQYVAIFNPPYGKRIKLEGELDAFIDRIIKHSKIELGLEKVALIFPSWALHKLKDLNFLEKRFITNGGIEVVFVIVALDI